MRAPSSFLANDNRIRRDYLARFNRQNIERFSLEEK